MAVLWQARHVHLNVQLSVDFLASLFLAVEHDMYLLLHDTTPSL